MPQGRLEEGQHVAFLLGCLLCWPCLLPALSGFHFQLSSTLSPRWLRVPPAPQLPQVSDEERLQAAGLEPHDVGTLLLEAFADMTFVHGFVHGDPHPGKRSAQCKLHGHW